MTFHALIHNFTTRHVNFVDNIIEAKIFLIIKNRHSFTKSYQILSDYTTWDLISKKIKKSRRAINLRFFIMKTHFLLFLSLISPLFFSLLSSPLSTFCSTSSFHHCSRLLYLLFELSATPTDKQVTTSC